MTTITLQNCSPFLKAFNKEPNFSYLRVFGCACYPLLRPYTLTTSYFFLKTCIKRKMYPHNGDGYYHMRLKKLSRNKARRHVVLIGIKSNADVWHSRLGHVNHQVLQFMFNHQQIPVLKSKSNQLWCTLCQLAKSGKLPFCDSSRVTSTPLELIHSYIWISSVSTSNGYKYYIIFVDDFSRHTWPIPLKHKSDALEQFVKFKCLTENLFSLRIKQLQKDGGGEYSSSAFSKFLADHGIFHRTTCPLASQQNGIAERKHRLLKISGRPWYFP
jgi:transposase InsO family protein